MIVILGRESASAARVASIFRFRRFRMKFGGCVVSFLYLLYVIMSGILCV